MGIKDKEETAVWDIKHYAPTLPEIVFERVRKDAVLPKYADEHASGMDVYAAESVILLPQEQAIIPIGVKMHLPKHPYHDLGYRWGVTVRPRSGLSSRTSLVVALGTVDNNYRHEVGVIVKNDAQIDYAVIHDTDDNGVPYNIELYDVPDRVFDLEGKAVPLEEVAQIANPLQALVKGSLLIRKGDRIAQLVVEQVVRPLAIREGKVSDEDARGGGFGHTGVRG